MGKTANAKLTSMQSMVTADSSLLRQGKEIQVFKSNTGLYNGNRFARQVWTSQDSRQKSVVQMH